MAERPVALVTGGSRGIGRGIALELARLGHDLVLSHLDTDAEGRPDAGAAEGTRAAVEAIGAACEVVRADVAVASDRERLLARTRERFGRLHLLVNNAGVAPAERRDLLEATEESFDRVLAVNLKGPYFLTQLAARWMIRQREEDPGGAYRIVNTGSISAFTSSPSRGEYCVSKAGVGMMTALFADRLAEHGIGVFETRPGIIRTDMTKAVEEKYDRLIAGGLTPIRRWGTPEDVARAVGAIAEGRLDFCAGQVIHVDGGFHLRRL